MQAIDIKYRANHVTTATLTGNQNKVTTRTIHRKPYLIIIESFQVLLTQIFVKEHLRNCESPWKGNAYR